MMNTRKQIRNLNFEELTKACGCDRDAQNWLKVALDPFHDYNVQLAGLPDNDSQPSAIQIVPKVYQIKAPAGLAVNETWSAHISTLPIASTHACRSYYRNNTSGVVGDAAVTLSNDGQAGEIGTITVITHGDAGGLNGYDNLSYPANVAQATDFGAITREFKAFSLDDDNDKTMKKLVAGGFEVHNDTAALYKQGSVTVYSSGQGTQREGALLRNADTSTVYHHQHLRKSRQPPGSKAEAGSMPDSRTFEAADGCYVPIRLGDDTHYSIASRTTYLTESVDSSLVTTRPAGYVITPFAATAGYSEDYQANHRPLDIETTGAYFSGLSPETTLTLTIKFIIELCPTSSNQAMLYMASPTAMYCPRAIELYHQMIRSLPPGVPVSFNDKGDWFRMATKVMADVAPLVSPFLSALNPTLGAGVQLAGQVAKATNKAISKQETSVAPNQKSTQPPPRTKVVSQPNIGRSVARKK
ncbi:hypothetical protein 1 [Beihai tombus-like virus 17]|uniref:hypothetical protein 1 n=1 Tax=Beihai tombus-like virus 17 TaxID=1922720 RepID=UPI00090B210A|nr:hypothetical protein 1 [Beihai tombus-like virus 17]APG76182.1 hypothetical protein 1 [Beihai tombus-like virus 17]